MDNRFYFGFNTSEERKKRRKAELYSMSEQVSTFFWDEAPQHGLEMREGQQDMSFEIVDALINDQHFAIEAARLPCPRRLAAKPPGNPCVPHTLA